MGYMRNKEAQDKIKILGLSNLRERVTINKKERLKEKQVLVGEAGVKIWTHEV